MELAVDYLMKTGVWERDSSVVCYLRFASLSIDIETFFKRSFKRITRKQNRVDLQRMEKGFVQIFYKKQIISWL